MQAKVFKQLIQLSSLLLLISFFVILPFGCDPYDSSSSDRQPYQLEQTEQEEQIDPRPEIQDELDQMEYDVFDQINEYRLSQGLPALEWNETIVDFCRTHSLNMANGTVPFSHDGFYDRVDGIGEIIRLRAAGENVAYNNYPDPVTTAVNGWIKSPGHLANIVGDYTLTGVGVAEGRNGTYYFTQIFIHD